ncbi:hypothetical protein AAG906_001068 [Vitis piasezkii]
MRSLHVTDGVMSWDGYDDLPVAALPVEFRMSDIERYTGSSAPYSLACTLCGIEEGISRGLWADSSHSDSKGKKSGSGPRPLDVGTIGMMGHRSRRP